MLFASIPFLLVFLPAVIAGAMLTARLFGPRGVIVFLSLSSFVFYGWYYPPYLVLLLTTIVVNYLLGQAIRARPTPALLTLGVGLNLGLLGWFKYAGFFADMLSAFGATHLSLPAILLPLGISFFTFQQIAFLVDVKTGKAEPGAFLDYVLLISFFPQLIAGPIVHHAEFIPQLKQPRFAKFHAEDVAAGLFLFTLGLAKKVLIADNLAPGADQLFHAQALGVEISLIEAWFGMLCYTFQIYFDFSGYSDMALGLGLMFGLKLPVNFHSPYKATSIVEFWRRWNITLSTFLRDYLYFPLGGNRQGPIRRYANLWIVMLLGGLWHGAGWQFVVWGGLHGAYLTMNHLWLRHTSVRLPAIAATTLTFVSVIVAWVFFRAADFDQAADILLAMIGLGAAGQVTLDIFLQVDVLILVALVATLLVWFAPNALEVTERISTGDGIAPAAAYRIAGALAGVSLFVTYASGSHAFIYFQF